MQAKDLNGDGKIDAREKAASMLGTEATEHADEPVSKKKKRTSFVKANSPKGNSGSRTANNRAGVSEHYLEMFENDPDEVIVAEIKKHPIGLVFIWTVTALLVIGIWAVVGLISWRHSDVATSVSFSEHDLTVASTAIALCLSAFALIGGYISAFLYANNRMIVTNEKIVQIRYFTLFSRKVTSLSMGHVQDVTATQAGLFPILFGYGKIVIETAGEQDNYEFTMAVRATENSKIIVQCHEENLHEYGN